MVGWLNVLLEHAVLGVALRVLAEVLHPGAPVRAVPDDLFDAHPARRGACLILPASSGAREELDELARVVAVGRGCGGTSRCQSRRAVLGDGSEASCGPHFSQRYVPHETPPRCALADPLGEARDAGPKPVLRAVRGVRSVDLRRRSSAVEKALAGLWASGGEHRGRGRKALAGGGDQEGRGRRQAEDQAGA